MTRALDARAAGFRAPRGGRRGCATMFGYGPRYLHSTGQLHKGGAEQRRLRHRHGTTRRRPADSRRAVLVRRAGDGAGARRLPVARSHRPPRAARPSAAAGRGSAAAVAAALVDRALVSGPPRVRQRDAIVGHADRAGRWLGPYAIAPHDDGRDVVRAPGASACSTSRWQSSRRRHRPRRARQSLVVERSVQAVAAEQAARRPARRRLARRRFHVRRVGRPPWSARDASDAAAPRPTDASFGQHARHPGVVLRELRQRAGAPQIDPAVANTAQRTSAARSPRRRRPWSPCPRSPVCRSWQRPGPPRWRGAHPSSSMASVGASAPLR